jgi:hypothetical protein
MSDDVPRPRVRKRERKRVRENGRWYEIERADNTNFPKQNMQRERQGKSELERDG